VARFGGHVSIDLGTGDGRLPYLWAREASERLFVGVDAHAAGMREWSGRALREGLDNLLYVRAAVEDLPSALSGVADRLSVILPWGSLLAALVHPSVGVLRGIRAVCQPDAVLTTVLGVDLVRDHAELHRLGLASLLDASLASRLAESYALAGFRLGSVRRMARDELGRWPSTWARRLAHSRGRTLLQLTATARIG
jgi:16S rRNA (adenine(1408)-N(1))-methyltransferase